jgi:hypothetical protein
LHPPSVAAALGTIRRFALTAPSRQLLTHLASRRSGRGKFTAVAGLARLPGARCRSQTGSRFSHSLRWWRSRPSPALQSPLPLVALRLRLVPAAGADPFVSRSAPLQGGLGAAAKEGGVGAETAGFAGSRTNPLFCLRLEKRTLGSV